MSHCCNTKKCASCTSCSNPTKNTVQPCSKYKCTCLTKDFLESVTSIEQAKNILDRTIGIDLSDFDKLENGYFYIKVECSDFHKKYREWFAGSWKKSEEDERLDRCKTCSDCKLCK